MTLVIFCLLPPSYPATKAICLLCRVEYWDCPHAWPGSPSPAGPLMFRLTQVPGSQPQIVIESPTSAGDSGQNGPYDPRGWRNVEKRPTLAFFFSEPHLTPPPPPTFLIKYVFPILMFSGIFSFLFFWFLEIYVQQVTSPGVYVRTRSYNDRFLCHNIL